MKSCYIINIYKMEQHINGALDDWSSFNGTNLSDYQFSPSSVNPNLESDWVRLEHHLTDQPEME